MIRPAAAADASRIAEILIFSKRTHYREIFHNDPVSFGEMQVYPLAKNYIDHPDALNGIWVYDDAFVKGMIHIEGNQIAELYVDPFFEGQGIGSKLIGFAIEQKNCGCLWVLEKNTKAIRFYQKHGFSLTEEKQLQEGTPEFIVKMTRWIQTEERDPMHKENPVYSKPKKKIAFICVHNSCRSQIAEALGKHLAADVFDSYSAGTERKPQINPDAVRLMKELYGIDMEKTQYSKLISDIPAPDIAVSMGCNVRCPFIGRAFDEDWGLEDPTGKPDEEFRVIIKRIEEKIFELIEKCR